MHLKNDTHWEWFIHVEGDYLEGFVFDQMAAPVPEIRMAFCTFCFLLPDWALNQILTDRVNTETVEFWIVAWNMQPGVYVRLWLT
jgi:hypothetical protein